jgi:hypothetical protein
LKAPARATKEEDMRSLRRKGDGRWHDVTEQRVRFAEHKIQRQASDPKSGLMLLSEEVGNATLE